MCSKGDEPWAQSGRRKFARMRLMNVGPRGLRAFRSRPASRRQHTDMVVLAPIKEQSRLSLGSYGRPRMTEALQEVGIDVGHRRVGRLMRENGIVIERTRKFKVRREQNLIQWIKFPAARQTATTPSTSRRTCWTVTSRRIGPTRTEGPRSEMGRRYQLCVDPRGLVVSGRDPRSALAARHRMGRQQPDETRSVGR
jgi:transposase InsO family protein